ncbi:hypothetical protein [Streptomyces parvus]|uniref:hypothetical protein n=1 Tax=Streptomyces parvus TaxID=66428 RepID=UPI0033E4DFBC
MEQDEDPRQAARQPDQDPKAQARAAKSQARSARAALASMLAPVRRRTRLAMALQIVGAAATIVPYIAIAELAKVLLAPGPADAGEVRGAVLIAVLGLSVRALFGGVALAVTHFADVALQASLRRRIVARLGRARSAGSRPTPRRPCARPPRTTSTICTTWSPTARWRPPPR